MVECECPRPRLKMKLDIQFPFFDFVAEFIEPFTCGWPEAVTDREILGAKFILCALDPIDHSFRFDAAIISMLDRTKCAEEVAAVGTDQWERGEFIGGLVGIENQIVRGIGENIYV
jgi:hypothetical protein